MQIKKIDIFGFKSFADRAVITIDDPITAIVGPNGCGKSNILDAIRWCMGEQSAKHLRGKAMEDVIFAGSETRQAAGMAEVSLTFENVGLGIARQSNEDETAEPLEEADEGADAEAQRILTDEPSPIDFSQYGEVTVTRRLFRDGTSEYLLNKTQCRLRDVTDFFLGTGVGTKAYSIIEQGRVGMIVSAKPEDRRLLIEEAAGITKFKKRKQAAERKMEQTRVNLIRVSDIVGELDKQVASLRRQAQKAERYKKYRAEVKDIELWSAAHRMLGFLAEVTFLGEKLETAETARDAASARVETSDAAIIATRAELVVEERRLADLTQAVFDLENQVQLADSQIEASGREARAADAQAQGADSERIQVTERAGLAESERERVAAEGARLDEEVLAAEARLAEMDAEQVAARGALAQAERALGEARQRVTRAQADIARHEGEARAGSRRRDDLVLRQSRLAEELARAVERHQAASGDAERIGGTLDGLRQLRLDLGEQRAALEARLGHLKDDHRTAVESLDQVRGELSRARSRHKALSDVAARYEGFARGTRALMTKQSAAGTLGLVADKVTAPPGLETAVEALLGDRLGALLVENAAAGADAIAWLKGHTEGRAAFVPVGQEGAGDAPALPEGALSLGALVTVAEPSLQPLFASAVVVDTLADALAGWRPGQGITWVTREGDVVDPHGVLVGGSRETAGAGVLEQKRELRELAERIAVLETQFTEAEARKTGLAAELQQVGQALDGLRRDSHQGEMQLLGQEKDFARLRGEAERANERRAQLERERDELAAAVLVLGREEEAIAGALLAARDAADAAEKDQLGLIEGVTTARTVLDEASAKLTGEKVLAARATSERQSVRTHLRRLEEELGELARRRASLEQTEAQARAQGEAARQRAEELRSERVGLVEERRTRADVLARDRGAHEQRQAAVQVAEVELRGLRSERDKAAAEATRLALRLTQIEADRRHVEETIEERYRLAVRTELQGYHLRAPVGPAEEARLRELRELIERMGEINLTAIDELEETSRRYDFLVKEKRDLELALGQLERAIAKINKVSRKRFRETFDAVNQKFREIFPRLFRGGHAELRLVAVAQKGGTEGAAPDSDDQLLDAGVEIVACPPGKKNTTVELLSGGEKALTAVAMIFAIFLIKPSPFCILDEVDAPLDEANVGRYNDLVREMTEQSQFVVITHNKRTMEIADSLYGVTMEEPGSSKMVSVQLRRFNGEKQAA